MQCLLSLITLESSGVRCTNAHFTVTLATTCWTIHPIWGPVYGGTVAVTKTGYECRAWNAPQEIYPTYGLDSMYPSDKNSRTAASNYCRIFYNNNNGVWCYWTKPFSLYSWAYCDVPRCVVVPGQRLPQTEDVK